MSQAHCGGRELSANLSLSIMRAFLDSMVLKPLFHAESSRPTSSSISLAGGKTLFPSRAG